MTIFGGRWEEAFQTEGATFAKTPKWNKLWLYKGQKGGQRSPSVGSEVERFEMSQKCGWEPHHVGRLWSLEGGIWF